MITLIATTHKEKGICNSNELLKIIEQISPEILFEEIPPQKFEAVYKGLRKDSLETGTIKRYLQKYHITHLPVDLDTDEMIDKSINNDFDKLTKTFNYHSPEYYYLSAQLRSMSEQLGFPYLNSDQCRKLIERQSFLEEDILRFINNETASQAYQRLLNFMNSRRNEMIKNIYSYSDLSKYDKALFLVGAQHRKPIMDKIPEFEKDNNRQLNWNFKYFN